ncbi:TadE family type IV pilus minor pilin [Actinoplanes philippinensis]|uniref:TadE family type IV pilus minor pilin n=1 Tax=Actinoplanes philippinensis TaxID=35752 RepID=UPI0033E96A41
MTRRRHPGRDRGSFTAELAAGLPALMLLLSLGLASVSAIAAKMQCFDAAREAALAEARGEAPAEAAAGLGPEGASVRVGGTAESVVAEVSVPIRLFGIDLPGAIVSGDATAAREPTGEAVP